MSVQLQSWSTARVEIPARAMMTGRLERQNHAIRVTCSVPVSLHASYGKTSFLVILPTSSLSNMYLIPGSFHDSSFIAIMPASGDVFVTLKPTSVQANSCIRLQSGPHRLQDRDVLYLHQPGCDFGGTLVDASNRVAVYFGSKDSQTGHGSFVDDVTSAQVLPLHMWGNEFIFSVPAKIDGNRASRILVSKDSTNVKRTSNDGLDENVMILKAGQYMDHVIESKVTYYYQSSEPIYVTVSTNGPHGVTLSTIPSLNLYQNTTLVPLFWPKDSVNQILMLTAESDRFDHLKINNEDLNVTSTGGRAALDAVDGYSIISLPQFQDTKIADVNSISSDGSFSAKLYGVDKRASFVVNLGYGSYQASAVIEDYFDQRIKLTCDLDTWEITLNTTLAKASDGQIFSQLSLGGISECKGKMESGSVIFKYRFSECGTKTKVIGDRTVYTNSLGLGVMPVNNYVCSLAKQTHVLGKYADIIRPPNVKITVSAVGDGSDIQVEVSAPSIMWLDMVVNNCSTYPTGQASAGRNLIDDRCPVDSTVQIMSILRNVTRFSFQDENRPGDTTEVVVECSVHYCLTGDKSSECQRSCPSGSTPVA